MDYDAMQSNMLFLKERRGVEIVTFVLGWFGGSRDSFVRKEVRSLQ
jgi:hypothetical protein